MPRLPALQGPHGHLGCVGHRRGGHPAARGHRGARRRTRPCVLSLWPRPSFRESRAVRAGTALHTCGVMSWKARACWSCSRGPGTFSPLTVVKAGGRVVLSGRVNTMARFTLMGCSFNISPDVSKPLAGHTHLEQRRPPGPQPPAPIATSDEE